MKDLSAVICVTALAGMGGTGLGALVSCLLRRESARAVSLLLSFAAGVMTGVVCFDLLRSALYPENGPGQTALPVVIGAVSAGFGVIALLNLWIDCRGSGGGRSGLFLAGLVMAVAIALHNVPEGMVIGASFAGGGSPAALRSGLMMAAVIGLHNIPEGMAVAAPLISGGMSKPRAAVTAALTGAPTVLGALAGYFLGALGPLALAVSLSAASGAMLYVVFAELLPESMGLWRSKVPALAVVAGILAGLLLVYA